MRYLNFKRSNEIFYKPSFYRHLHNLTISGFYARELDADDHEFLEYVKVRGIANGSLPNTSLVSLEELEYWQLPYAIEPGVEQKSGPVPLRVRAVVTPDQLALRKARTSAWHARRIIRAEEKALSDAELARERSEWEKANERRKLRDLLTDAEWDAAAPFGATIKRHHIPQWKLDEQGLIPDRPPDQAWLRKREAKRLQKAAKERRQAIAAEKERQRSEAIIEDARKTVVAVERMVAEQKTETPITYRTADELKRAVDTLIRSAPTRVWTPDSIERSLGCNRAMLDVCLHEMVRDAQLLQNGQEPERKPSLAETMFPGWHDVECS
jgi:hypothetical protein